MRLALRGCVYSYFLVVKGMLSVFDCSKKGNVYILDADPSIECDKVCLSVDCASVPTGRALSSAVSCNLLPDPHPGAYRIELPLRLPFLHSSSWCCVVHVSLVAHRCA